MKISAIDIVFRLRCIETVLHFFNTLNFILKKWKQNIQYCFYIHSDAKYSLVGNCENFHLGEALMIFCRRIQAPSMGGLAGGGSSARPSRGIGDWTEKKAEAREERQ